MKTLVNKIKGQFKNVIPEIIPYQEQLQGFGFCDYQYKLCLQDFTIIVGVNDIDMMEPEVHILETTDDNDRVVNVNDSELIELTELSKSLNYKL